MGVPQLITFRTAENRTGQGAVGNCREVGFRERRSFFEHDSCSRERVNVATLKRSRHYLITHALCTGPFEYSFEIYMSRKSGTRSLAFHTPFGVLERSRDKRVARRVFQCLGFKIQVACN